MIRINMEKTGQNIKETMRFTGKRVKDIQEACGTTTQAVYKWLNGDCLPTIENLATIADECRVTMDDLIICERV